MKLPHFLLLCACACCSSSLLAQAGGRPVPEENVGQTPAREPQQDFSQERPERLERFEYRNRVDRSQPVTREEMSIEERRQLRRDVDEAGRQLYRRPDKY